VRRANAGASPPTERALDVVELLASRADRSWTLAEVIRELRITRATGHAILTTFLARGWVERDPLDKSFRIGPALGIAARSADAARPLENAARSAAEELARELGFPVSLTQPVGEAIVIVHFVTSEHSNIEANTGDRVPLAAPFAQTFVAWEPKGVRRAWIERSAIHSPSLEARLEQSLGVIRERGYAVERMSASATRALRLVATLRGDEMSGSMRAVIEQLLVEISTVDYPPRVRAKHPVSTIAAPVFDERSRVALTLAAHPFVDLPSRRIEYAARVVTRIAARISRGSAPAGGGSPAD
jgi:DNA-binding IclR family transcriptional regulator